MCLRAPSVPDLPLHHAGDPVRSIILGNLAVLSPGRVLATPVLEAEVHPVLNRLHQLLTEGQGHHGSYQPLGRQAGDLVKEERHLIHFLLGRQLLPARAVLWRAAVRAGIQGAGFDTTNHSLFHPLLLSRSSKAGYDRPWCSEKAAPPTML